MERARKLLFYLVINVAVSACTVLVVLILYNRFAAPPMRTPPVATAAPTVAPTVPAAVLPAEPTKAPLPTSMYNTYQVQEGDTLDAIALQFDTTLPELMGLNNIENPNMLSVGQILLIPYSVEQLAATELAIAQAATATPTTVPTPLPTFAPAADPAEFAADEVIPIEIVTVVGAGLLEDERVMLRYKGETPLDLAGWQLQSPRGESYLFSQIKLYGEGAVMVYSGVGTDSTVELYWGLDHFVWHPGDEVLLLDPQGNQRAVFAIP